LIIETLPGLGGVTKPFASRTGQERPATEGDSPVDESDMVSEIDHLSTTWKVSHVGNWADHRPRLNTLGDR
jgi:hypothetical protein